MNSVFLSGKNCKRLFLNCDRTNTWKGHEAPPPRGCQHVHATFIQVTASYNISWASNLLLGGYPVSAAAYCKFALDLLVGYHCWRDIIEFVTVMTVSKLWNRVMFELRAQATAIPIEGHFFYEMQKMLLSDMFSSKPAWYLKSAVGPCILKRLLITLYSS